ncbi:MAG: 4-vinyl reductase [Candidatus Diapherotrites archaeon]|nr:4-vinyl reductase [Candidatus Diapherotrites archaeon]
MAKLLIQNQLKLEENAVSLFGHRMSILPSYGFVELQKKLHDENLENISYRVFKKVSTAWITDFKNHFQSKGEDLVVWAKNLSNLTGWGEFDLVEINQKKFHYEVVLKNSAVAETIFHEQGLVEKPADDLFRGLIAGSLSVISGKDLDAVETQCVANGFNECRFEVRPLKDFNLKNHKVKAQLKK